MCSVDNYYMKIIMPYKADRGFDLSEDKVTGGFLCDIILPKFTDKEFNYE